MPINVWILEDQAPVLKGLVKVLSAYDEINLTQSMMSAEEGLELLKSHTHPQVILCDLGLSGLSGCEFTKRVKQKYPAIEVLIFTIFEQEDHILKAIQAGASGYLLKGTPAPKIVEAILDVSQGGSVIQPNLAKKLLKHFQAAPPETAGHVFPLKRHLTNRELECLQMVAKGLSNTETAGVLGLSKATIRTHLEHIYQKLDVSNRVEAVTEGLRQGIIEI